MSVSTIKKIAALCCLLALACLAPHAARADEPLKGVATIYSGEPNRDAIVFDQRQGNFERGTLVPDGDAPGRFALRHDPKKQSGGGMLWFGYTYNQAPGRMRAVFRLKVADNTDPAPVAFIRGDVFHSDLSDPAAGWLELPVRGTDFKKPNVYQDFPLERTRGELGFGDWAVRTTGAAVSFGGLTVHQVSRFTLPELLALMRVPVKPAGLVVDRGGPVHEVRGLYSSLWGATPGTVSYVKFDSQNTGLTGFPEGWPAPYACRAVVLDNVSASAVTLVRCLMLKEYVRDGGCLVLMGDTHGLSGGGWADTPLAPLLPATLRPGDRPVRADTPLVIRPVGAAFAGLDWAARPYTLFTHEAVPRPGAEILLEAGGHPIALQGVVGQGRVILLLCSVLGDKPAGAPGLPWWEWPGWPRVMAGLIDGK